MSTIFTHLYIKRSISLLLTLLIFFIFNQILLAQVPNDPKSKVGADKPQKKKKAKFPPEDLTGDLLKNAKYNFKASALKNVGLPKKDKSLNSASLPLGAVGAVSNVNLTDPTSLQFGPDGRLYVSQQNGIIYAFTITRSGANNYSVTSSETINNINLIPNHNDNGALNTSVNTRQVTGILVTGTSSQPVLYVSSSDSRIGGPSGDLNLDTNSGIISRLTKINGTWQKVDLVRGLPRSEENHSNNGMQLNGDGTVLYVAIGGSTNAGSPSTNFAYTVEYALSAAIISINLNTINSMSVKNSGTNTAYIYDLPTLDDPTRSNSSPGLDVNDPFGGNDGLNQAKIVSGGPVQIYSPGYRNAYDLVVTKTPGKAGRMYTIDNGPNQGWGGYPQNEGGGSVTNNYVVGEPGSTGAGTNDPQVNNLDNLHYIGNIGSYVAGSYYAGHPTPIRANPGGAGLYTHNGSSGVFRTSTSGTNPLPADWPPVPQANPIEGNFQLGGVSDNSILTFSTSTNGIAEYTGSHFSNILQGTLLAASFDGKLWKIKPTDSGTDVTNPKGGSKLIQDLPFASGFGSTPLDVTTQGDNDIFPGTVWVATYGSNSITVFEPEASTSCSGQYNSSDDDGDKYTNADEIDNGTNPCSAASKPDDNDGDLVSDLNDNNDDNDSLTDNVDYFPLDPQNGTTTNLPIQYDLFNNSPGTGFFGLGFTGLMSNTKPDNDYYDLYDENNLIAGGAVGAFSVVAVSTGDAYGTINNQENAFQFGVNTTSSTGPFKVQGRMLGPFFNNQAPIQHQSQGIYIGTGDQDNYLKITLNAGSNGTEGIQVVYENNGSAVEYQYPLDGGMPNSTLDLYLDINPSTGTVQPKYAQDGNQIISVGSPITVSGALLTAIQGTPALAVGIISTCLGSKPFTATWDAINVTTGTVTPGNKLAVSPTSLHFFSQQAGTTSSSKPVTLTNNQSTSTQVTAVTLAGANNSEFSHNFTTPIIINGGASATINVTFKPASAGGKSAQLQITQSGVSTPLTVDLTGEGINNSNQPPTANAGTDKAITLPNNSVVLNGSGTDPESTTLAYAWTQSSGPSQATFSSTTAQNPTVSGLVAGSYVFSLVVKDTPGASSPADQVSVMVNPATGGTLIYRINAGGGEVTNSIGTFAADNYFSPSPGFTYFNTGSIAGTSNGAIYQTERSSDTNNGTFSYNFPVKSAQYKVILHFAELYWNSSGQRLFDVSLENNKVLDNYDVFQKSGGSMTATAETFLVTVTDGTLNLLFSASLADGGKDRPKVSAIEVIEQTSTTNQAPVLASIGNKTVTVGQALTFTATATDPDAGQSKTFSLVSAPSGAAINASTGAFSWTPATAGTFTFTVKVADNGSPVLTDEEQITVTVNPTSTGSQQLVSFTLINADTEQEIKTIAAGETLNLNTLPTKNLNIRANTNPTTVGSVKFELSGPQTKTGAETAPPYALFGDSNGNYNAWTPATGTYSLTGTPYSGAGASGTAGTPLTISFTVSTQTSTTNQAPTANAGSDKSITLPTNSVGLTGSGTDPEGSVLTYAWTQSSGPSTATISSTSSQNPTVSNLIQGTYVFSLVVKDSQGANSSPDQVSVVVNPAPSGSQQLVSFTLINADTEQEIKTIAAGETLNLNTLPTKNLNIRANTNPTTVGSVKFELSGPQTKTGAETAPPYALFGDSNGNYNAWTPATGTYSLTGTPYSGAGASGTAGTPLTISFTVSTQTTAVSARTSSKNDYPVEISPTEYPLIIASPNPFKDVINLKVEDNEPQEYSIKVYDELGKLLYHNSFKPSSPNADVLQIQLSDGYIPKGMYLLHIENKTKKAIKVLKIIKD